jgi:hypothetical protein
MKYMRLPLVLIVIFFVTILGCVIRGKAATESGACRPPKPMEAVH